MSSDRQTDRNLSFQAGGTQELTPALSMQVKAKYARDRLLFLDVSEVDPAVSARWDYLQQSGYLSTALAWQASERWHFGGAVDGQYETLRSEIHPGRRTLYAAASAAYLHGPWRTNVALQYQHSEGSGSYRFLSPSAILTWTPDAYWEFGGLLKRSCRLPSFNDLYYSQMGNSALIPESALQFGTDLRLSGSSAPWSYAFRLSPYYNRVSDKIVAIPTSSQFRWTMLNIGIVDVTGLDVKAQAGFSAGAPPHISGK